MFHETLAIIPARGGSERISHKNIRPFFGKPIIEYSIEVALNAGCFDEVMVSTDDTEIAEISKSCGAEVPFLRSEKNSDAYTGLVEVMKEVLEEYEKIGKHYTYFCCIYPTAPFITAERLIEGMKLLKQTNADSVLTVTRHSDKVWRSLELKDGRLEMLFPDNYHKRSQEFNSTYYDNAQFCCMKSSSLLEQMTFFAKETLPFILEEFEAQDINVEEDWEKAEKKYKNITRKNN
jgi:pseudaminic acid cytidylyltransferase